MKGVSIKNAMVTTIGRILQSEIAALCSDDFDSIMRLKTKGSVKVLITLVGHNLPERLCC